jgi:hypothetical protein
MTTYKQLWARSAPLSIATLGADKCKFLLLAETFSTQKGSKFAGLLLPVSTGLAADSSGTRTVLPEAGWSIEPSKLEKSPFPLCSLENPAFWRRVRIQGRDPSALGFRS